MDDQEDSAQSEQQQEQKKQDTGPGGAGRGLNAAINIGTNLFRLGKFSLSKKKPSPESEAADKATEEAEKVVKKGASFILKRSAFALGATFFWVILIFVFFLALFFILFPSGGVIPDSAKALIPTSAPFPTNTAGTTGSSPGTTSGGGATGGGATSPPPPSQASSSISDTAINLVQILQSGCAGQVNSGNYTCAQAIFSGGILFPDLAYSEIAESAANYDFLQCIGFVNAIVGGATGVSFPRVGNAADYDRDISGFTFIPVGGTIAVGDIVVWDNGGFGHIGVAVQVYDQNNIQVAEGNFDFHGGVDLRNRVISSEPNLKGWLRKS